MFFRPNPDGSGALVRGQKRKRELLQVFLLFRAHASKEPICRSPATKIKEQETPSNLNEIPWPSDDEEIQHREYPSGSSDSEDEDTPVVATGHTALGSTQGRSYESGTLSYGPVNPSRLSAFQLAAERSIALESKDLSTLVLFDRRAEVVKWPNGYRTFLPFLASNEPNAKNDRACEEDFVRSMATLPLFTHGDAGMLPGRVVKGGPPLKVARTISKELANGHSVHVRPSIHRAVQWSLSDFRKILGLHAAGIVNVQEPRGTRPIEHTLGEFFEQCQQQFWAVIDHPVRDTGMPWFTEDLDDGYSLGWRSQIPQQEDGIQIPYAVERQHSWVWLLPATYLRQGKPEHTGGALQGQATLFQVRLGWIFLALRVIDEGDAAATREELHAQNDRPDGSWRLVLLKPGDIIIIPPGSHYNLYAPQLSIITGRYFYNLSCLHLTEAARMSIKHKVDDRCVNTSLDVIAAWETLIRLLAALPFVNIPPMKIKPLLALVAMCQRPNEYVGENIEWDARMHAKQVNWMVQHYLITTMRKSVEAEQFSDWLRSNGLQKLECVDGLGYELCQYQTNALDLSIHAFLNLDGGRYTYPTLHMINDQAILCKDRKDYLFENDLAQHWQHPGRRLMKDEWAQIFAPYQMH